MLTTTWAILVSCIPVQAPPAGPSGLPVPGIAMEDQFERPQNVSAMRGAMVVLIYGDRRSADANKQLGEALHVRFHPGAQGLPPEQARQAPVRPLPELPPGQPSPDVFTVPVASIGPVPNLVRAMIRRQIKSASPQLPVWLDFEDTMRRQFGLKAGVPNLVLLDTLGRLRYAGSGPFGREQIEQLAEAIEACRREAVAVEKK
jgi:hypothetical protein